MRLLAFLVVVLLAAALARADTAATSARAHFEAGARAFDVGEYEEAAREFATAYKTKSDPTLLYNLAQAHRMAGHLEEARRAYMTYAARLPNAPNMAEVQRRIAELSVVQPPVETPAQIAARLYARGEAHRVAGELTDAVADLSTSNATVSTPATELALARTYESLGKREDALRWYRAYADSTPPPPEVAEARARIVALSPPPPALAIDTTLVAPAPPPKKRKRWVVPVAVVGSIVVVVAAVGLGVGLGVSEKNPSAASTVHFK